MAAQNSGNSGNTVQNQHTTQTLDDPLFILSSNHPEVKLVAHNFEGSIFGNWKHSMLIALSAKNKLSFIDGTNPNPPSTNPTSKTWQRCSDLVFSWILNALSLEIADSVLYCDSAQSIWQELQDRYAQTNGTRLYFVY
ncbi:hypothetical protein RND81_03G053400 [Saponaria officinalis]|uniref:Retrotransposon Copia-like N-terminal domain-containing protein n=1 Tax=Saponaria officinalis TaxID=3572 RepID=A0AAW1M3K7_SAPOF